VRCSISVLSRWVTGSLDVVEGAIVAQPTRSWVGRSRISDLTTEDYTFTHTGTDVEFIFSVLQPPMARNLLLIDGGRAGLVRVSRRNQVELVKWLSAVGFAPRFKWVWILGGSW
jgi:hypothetical protein